MNQKKAKTILLPLVLLIWGGALWLYLSPQNEYSPPLVTPVASLEHSANSLEVETTEVDSFELNLDYPDPFEGKLSQKVKKASPKLQKRVKKGNTVSTAPNEKAPEVEEIDWNLFRYQGRVRSSMDSAQVGLLSFRGKLLQVRSGGHYQGITVLNLWPDSIRIFCRGAQQTLKQ